MATRKSTDTEGEGAPKREQSEAATETARAKASKAAQKTQEEARRLSEKAKTQLAGQAEQQKDQASKQLEDIGAALRETSNTLHERDKDTIANVMAGAAHQLERLSGYMRDRSVNEMMSEAERLARREPEMFLGGAALLGLIGARFFKSSSPESKPPARRRLPPHERSSGEYRRGHRHTPQDERIRKDRPQPARPETRRPETHEERRSTTKSRSSSHST